MTRSLLSGALLLASLVLPAAAHATSFVLTPTGGTAITFTLTGAPSNNNPPYNTEFDKVQTSSGISTFYFYNPIALATIGAPPLDLGVSGDNSDNYKGVQLFTGSYGSPQFTTGTFTLVGSFNTASLVISNSALPVVSATPEPSSLALLGTGVLGLAGAARRRFLRA